MKGPTSFVKRCRALVRRGGGKSGGRLCRREHDKGYADDHEDDRTPQKSHALVRKLEGHRAHDEGVRETRSEEHTSELQSRLHLVCRLLLEKKKNTINYLHYIST